MPNATGQYDITLARGASDLPLGPPGGLGPCNTSIYGACYQMSNTDPYKRPFLALSDEYLTVTWKQKPRWAGMNFTTYQYKKPVSVQAFLCYSTTAALDRGWRAKNKAYPRVRLDRAPGFFNCSNRVSSIARTPYLLNRNNASYMPMCLLLLLAEKRRICALLRNIKTW